MHMVTPEAKARAGDPSGDSRLPHIDTGPDRSHWSNVTTPPTHPLLIVCVALAAAGPAIAQTSATNSNPPRGAIALPVALAYSDTNGIWVRRAGAVTAERWATAKQLFDAHLSPDGSRLSATLYEDGLRDYGSRRAIAIVEGKGSAPKRVPNIPGDQNYGPQWSPDGQWLLFQHMDEHWMAAVAHADGTGYREFAGVDAWGTWWAHDSKSIYVYNSSQVVHLSLDGRVLSRQRLEEALGQVEAHSGMVFSVSADGGRLLFEACQDVLDVKTEDFPPPLVFLKDLATGVIERVSPKGIPAEGPAWLPDGKTFVFASWNGKTRDIYLGRADGAAAILLKRNASGPSVSR